MEQFITDHFDAIVSLIVGILGGRIWGRYSNKEDSNNSNRFKKINTGGGDFAGRDIKK
jgi:hypothetical protein